MEPNNPNTQQGKGTQPPPKSPSQPNPQSGAPSSQPDATVTDASSRTDDKLESVEEHASELAVEVKKAAKAKVQEGADTAKKTVSSAVSHGAEALGKAADTLRDQGEETLAQTTTSVASGLSDYAERLERRSSEDLMQDMMDLARQNPTLFVLGSVGLGIALSRFFKASSRSTRTTG